MAKIRKELTLEEYRVANLERCNKFIHGLDEWNECEWFTCFAGECGEMGNFIKKRRRKGKNVHYKNEKLHLKDIKKEIGDCFAYLDLIATKFGLRLEDCARDKFNEVSDRYKGCKIKL